jgi:cytochrome P450
MVLESFKGNIRPVRGLPAVFSYLRFLRDPVASMLCMYHSKELIRVLGNVMPFRQRERLRVLALGPRFNREVLGNPNLFYSNRLTVPGPHNSAQQRLSKGLTALNGQIHEQERRLAIPLFQRNAVEPYYHMMIDVIDRVLKNWPIGECTNTWTQMRDLAIRNSAAFLFGNQHHEAYELGLLIHDWLGGTWSLPAMALTFNIPGTPYRRLLEKAASLERKMIRIIEEKRKRPVEGSGVLSLLLRSHTDNDVLVGQLTTLFAASYETMVNVLTWTLFLLAQHPGITADVLDELDGTLCGLPPTIEQLNQLPLLELVIKESMRVLPPVPYTIRQVNGSAELDGLYLNKGDRVILSHYVTHHMPDLYDEPEEFRPLRWSKISPSQYEYLPFSAGPRACIGYSYAMTVMKIVLSMILQRFRLTVIPGSRIDRLVQITMRPKFGIPMSVHRQDRRFQAVPVRGNIHEMVKLT